MPSVGAEGDDLRVYLSQAAEGTDPEHVRKLVDEAHLRCYIANSLNSDVRMSATIDVI